ADLNGDGKLDIVTANAGSNNVSVFLGNGDGTFGAPIKFAAGASPSALAIGDVNGDGKPDLAVADAGSDSVSILLGTGTAAFQAPQTVVVPSLPYTVGSNHYFKAPHPVSVA